MELERKSRDRQIQREGCGTERFLDVDISFHDPPYLLLLPPSPPPPQWGTVGKGLTQFSSCLTQTMSEHRRVCTDPEGRVLVDDGGGGLALWNRWPANSLVSLASLFAFISSSSSSSSAGGECGSGG